MNEPIKHDCLGEGIYERARLTKVGIVANDPPTVEILCVGRQHRWYLVTSQSLHGQHDPIVTKVQIHVCPWCGVRLLSDGESLADRPGEPGSYARFLETIEKDVERTRLLMTDPEVRDAFDAFVETLKRSASNG